jgi:hypothetical protein
MGEWTRYRFFLQQLVALRVLGEIPEQEDSGLPFRTWNEECALLLAGTRCTRAGRTKSKSHYDWRSASQYVLVSSPNLGLLTRDFFFQSNCLVFFGGALSDERSGLSCVSLCHWSLLQSVIIYIWI